MPQFGQSSESESAMLPRTSRLACPAIGSPARLAVALTRGTEVATAHHGVVASLGRLRELDGNTLYRHTAFQWELIEHLKGLEAAKVYSLRLSQRIRAIAFRDGDFLRLISLWGLNNNSSALARGADAIDGACDKPIRAA